MVVCINSEEELAPSHIDMSKKGRAKTLPSKVFIKSENLFYFSLNQFQYPINHFLYFFFELIIFFHHLN